MAGHLDRLQELPLLSNHLVDDGMLGALGTHHHLIGSNHLPTIASLVVYCKQDEK